jgi:hypothetical protein
MEGLGRFVCAHRGTVVQQNWMSTAVLGDVVYRIRGRANGNSIVLLPCAGRIMPGRV